MIKLTRTDKQYMEKSKRLGNIILLYVYKDCVTFSHGVIEATKEHYIKKVDSKGLLGIKVFTCTEEIYRAGIMKIKKGKKK